MFGADGIAVDGPARRLQGFGVGLGQIGADFFPALTFVGGFENLIAADVKHIAVVRRKDNRIGPGKAVFVSLGAQASRRARPSRDQANLLGAMVIALQAVAAAGRTADRADIHQIRVIGIDGNVAAFARTGDVTVQPQNRRVGAAARHAHAGIVLLGAINIVRLAAVGIQMIELRGRLIVNAGKRQPAVQ